MKKSVKFIGLAFFALVAFAFVIDVIDNLVGLGDLIDILSSDFPGFIKFMSVLSWCVWIVAGVCMLIVSVLAIIKLVSNLSDDESHYSVKPVVLLAGIFACKEIANFVIALINAIKYDYSVGGTAITTLIFAIIVIVLLVLTLLLKNVNKIVNVCTLIGAWLTVFIVICVLFGDASGAYLASLIFFMLSTFVAIAYIVLENIDGFKALLNNNSNVKKDTEEESSTEE